MTTVVTEKQLHQCVDLDKSGLDAITTGFKQLAAGKVTIPPIMGLEIPEKNGAADVKAAWVAGWDSFAVKLSTRFFDNYEKGLPSAGGMMTLLDSDTGRVSALLLDNGYLTTLRTALAGALAAKHLAPHDIGKVAVLGAGSQALWQLRALALVREFDRVSVYSRGNKRAQEYAAVAREALGVPVEPAASAEDAVRDADLIITTTPAREPLVQAGWVKTGAHVTAMGSDAAHKNELDPQLLARADLPVCDLKSQCRERGELHHALAAGAIDEDRVTELGEIVIGRSPGREHENQISVCDLTGVGVQDTAIARWALERALAAKLGREV